MQRTWSALVVLALVNWIALIERCKVFKENRVHVIVGSPF